MKKLKFEQLSLSEESLKAVMDLGFEEATPIQSLSIPRILKGVDVIGQAQTGTGKTAAFGLPILEKLDTTKRQPQALVLCPTRELAVQVAEEMAKLAKHKKHTVIVPIYGGQSIERQFQALKRGVHVIIGTPGRMLDHLRRKTLKLDAINTVVLDEADEMLDMGFRDDIEAILETVPKTRQTVCFSATMPKAFLSLTKKYLRKPELIKVVHDKLSAPDIEQIYYEIKDSTKLDVLSRLIDFYNLRLALVFCNTKRKVDDVVTHLQTRGYFAEGIHGDMNQATRDRVMNKFRKGTTEILVATDVAARGIDVENIEAVFNYDVPNDEEYYVHRIGRTGRAGKSGHAFTFASGRDIFKLRNIMRYAKVKINRRHVPSIKDVEEVRINQFFTKVREELQKASNTDLKRYTHMIEHSIGNEYSSLEVAAALLKMSFSQQAQAAVEAKKAPKESGFGETGASSGMVRLFINVGKSKNIKKGDILGAVAGETGLRGDLIGDIAIYDNFSFIEVPENEALRVISKMSRSHIKKNKISIEPANKKERNSKK